MIFFALSTPGHHSQYMDSVFHMYFTVRSFSCTVLLDRLGMTFYTNDMSN